MATVQLPADLMDKVWIEATCRMYGAVKNQRRTNDPASKYQEFQWHLCGALVEAATARYLETAWVGMRHDPDGFSAGLHDVAPNIEARYAQRDGPLRVRDKDRKWPPSTPYVLGWIDQDPWRACHVQLKGWLPLGDCYQFATPRNRAGTITWDVDQIDLFDMHLLKEAIHETY